MYAEHCCVAGEERVHAKDRFGTSFLEALFPCADLTADWPCVERALERDHFMTAEEALAFGLVDRIVQKRGKSGKAGGKGEGR